MSEQQEKPLERCSSNPHYEAHFGDSEQPREWTPENHHPSCSPHDGDLVWHCSQCGANESAEAWHNAAIVAAKQEGIGWADKQYYGISGHRRIRNLEQQLVDERETLMRSQHNHFECQQELAAERELREGDNKLIRALAEDAGIKITAPDNMLGAQWEQFHDGVMQLAAEREKRKSLVDVLEAIADREQIRSTVDMAQLAQRALDALVKDVEI